MSRQSGILTCLCAILMVTPGCLDVLDESSQRLPPLGLGLDIPDPLPAPGPFLEGPDVLPLEDFLHHFEEIPRFPIAHEPCHQTLLTRSFQPGYYHSEHTSNIQVDPHHLGSGGWTHFFSYNYNIACPNWDPTETKSFITDFGFTFRATNSPVAEETYVMQLGAKIEGTLDLPLGDWQQPFVMGHKGKMFETSFFFQQPFQPIVQFPTAYIEGSTPEEPERDKENCVSNMEFKIVLTGLSLIPKLGFLGIVSSLIPDEHCEAIWDHYDEWRFSVPGKNVIIHDSIVQHEQATGGINFRFLEPSQEFELTLIGEMQYDAAARFCYGCEKASMSGVHHYKTHPPMEVRDPNVG